MPNIYFCQAHTANHSVLRAVLSWEQSEELVSIRSCSYLGEKIPVPLDQTDESHDFAVLRIRKEESNQEWRPGFYRVDRSVTELNEALLRLSL